MLQFSVGALLLLLPLFSDVVLGEISADFHQCLEFFYEEQPPRGIRGDQYQPICQRYQNQYHFATLYDRMRRVPMYSAYKLSISEDSKPRNEWKYEPQLVSNNSDANMEDIPQNVDEDIKMSQAVDDDYKSNIGEQSTYTRGHLAPSRHQNSKADREATYTLTNIVPQEEGSNGGPWDKLENDMITKFKQYCEGTMYVITGAIPFEEEEEHWLKNRVSIPEYMWSAYCCPSYKNRIPKAEKSFFPTYAAVGRNYKNSGEEIVQGKGYEVKRMPLETLEGILTQRLAMPISLFDGQCHKGKKDAYSKAPTV